RQIPIFLPEDAAKARECRALQRLRQFEGRFARREAFGVRGIPALCASPSVPSQPWFQNFCPGGTSENSPAFQRRDQPADKPRPKGRLKNRQRTAFCRAVASLTLRG